ncbi:molecular chaperone TorD [Motilimonas pumila]|uniref:Chaperone protein TorD n=1 Tax=Motilimonas pumila TaxID=2303987 RepID=A0A418YIJ3_9GAMM|nr:molecular chaperone TorD [Motilimonas pumila]RJG50463.1 molecular chaperone TorD [Motilimonas pumila]
MSEMQQADNWHETRASLYWWLATLFTKELDKDEFKRYSSGEGRDFIQQLAADDELQTGALAMLSALSKLTVLQYPELELAADFSQIFLTDKKAGAPPYASVYRSESGLMMQQPHQDMVNLLQQQGLAVTKDFNEPADHIAIQLDYIGNVIMRDAEQVSPEQIDFIEQQLLSWVPEFATASHKVTNSGFYQGACDLLAQFIKADLADIKAPVASV